MTGTRAVASCLVLPPTTLAASASTGQLATCAGWHRPPTHARRAASDAAYATGSNAHVPWSEARQDPHGCRLGRVTGQREAASRVVPDTPRTHCSTGPSRVARASLHARATRRDVHVMRPGPPPGRCQHTSEPSARRARVGSGDAPNPAVREQLHVTGTPLTTPITPPDTRTPATRTTPVTPLDHTRSTRRRAIERHNSGSDNTRRRAVHDLARVKRAAPLALRVRSGLNGKELPARPRLTLTSARRP